MVPPSSAGVAHLLRLMCNLLRSCQVALDKHVPEDEEEPVLGGKEGVEFVRLVVTLCRVCQVLMASDAQDLEEGGKLLSSTLR